MNLETFKARARRKLEMSNRLADTDAEPELPRAPSVSTSQASETKASETKASETNASETKASETNASETADPSRQTDTSTDKFSAALYQAREKEISRNSSKSTPASYQALTMTGSPEQRSSARLQENQIESIQQRTQASINGLRKEMDASLSDLSKHIEQLKTSILNSQAHQSEPANEASWSGIVADTDAKLQGHNDRLDALEARLANTLTNLRTELEEDRESNRAFVKTELEKVNARTDELLQGMSARLESSIGTIETRLSEQLDSKSAGFIADSETTVNNLRTQLSNLIDERVRSFNEEQSAGLMELRDTLLSNTKEINSALKLQTEQQDKTLNSHREELESQFNAAIAVLTKSKVSHKDLSQLLARLADRLTQP